MKIVRQKNGLISYSGLYRNYNNFTVPLTGSHQLNNAALALATLEIAGRNGFPVNIAAIKKGMRSTKWQARLEVLCQRPLFVVDGAHNPAGISVLCRSLKNDFAYRRLILVFSALADKDYRKMIKIIAPLAGIIIITQLQAKRAVPVANIQECVQKMGYQSIIAENVRDSVNRAFDLAGEGDLICAAGSLYLAGEIKQAFPKAASYDKKPAVCLT